MIDERVDTLIIARRSLGSQKPKDVIASLVRFAPVDVGDSAWRAEVTQRIDRLGDVEKDALAKRIGKYHAKRWSDLADRVLPLVALGVSLDAKVKGENAWAAAIVARAYGLWNDGKPPSQSVVGNALVWKMLGIAGKPKACPAELRAHFLHKELGGDTGTFARQLRGLAAARVGAPRGDSKALTQGLVRMWLAGKSLGETPFANRVLEVARSMSNGGLYGDRKAFIGAVFDASSWPMSLPEFKSRLLVEHRAGRLELARADYLAAMDPDLVARSELTADGASFHFIVREERG